MPRARVIKETQITTYFVATGDDEPSESARQELNQLMLAYTSQDWRPLETQIMPQQISLETPGGGQIVGLRMVILWALWG